MFYPLVHVSNSHSSLGWGRPKLGAWSFTGWQVPKYLSHLLLLSWEPGLKLAHIMDACITGRGLTHSATTPLHRNMFIQVKTAQIKEQKGILGVTLMPQYHLPWCL